MTKKTKREKELEADLKNIKLKIINERNIAHGKMTKARRTRDRRIHYLKREIKSTQAMLRQERRRKRK